MNGAEIRRAVLTWLVAHGEPLRDQPRRFIPSAPGRKASIERGPDWTRDVYERLGAGMHLSGDRTMLDGIGKRRGMNLRARNVFTSWLEGVPEGGCELMFERCTWEDSSWTLYSSFDESFSTERGVDVQVFCACGRIAGVTWRYEGSWGDLLRGITEDGK